MVEVSECPSPGAWSLSQAQAWGPRFREAKPVEAGSSPQVLARITDTPPRGVRAEASKPLSGAASRALAAPGRGRK